MNPLKTSPSAFIKSSTDAKFRKCLFYIRAENLKQICYGSVCLIEKIKNTLNIKKNQNTRIVT